MRVYDIFRVEECVSIPCICANMWSCEFEMMMIAFI